MDSQVREASEIEIELPEKVQRVLTTKARFIVLIGGRGSAKTETMGRLLLMLAQTQRADILCGREYQNSIDDSVHKLLTGLVDRLGIQGVNVTEKKIDFFAGGGFRYKGFARNASAVRSAQDFQCSWVDEAQSLSEESIEHLLPTIRGRNSKLFFTGNPMASNDPFSQRFIMPFKVHLDEHGYYEDDTHLIIVMNWLDNPWHGELEAQRLWDYENYSRAKYDHIWEGAFNDTVEDSIIKAEWFDAAIDAHKVKGFDPLGARVVSYDPSDNKRDAQGLCLRHGSVILDVQENTTDELNDGCNWAIDYAIKADADLFIYDGDGMGTGLKQPVFDAFDGKKIDYEVFRSGEMADRPDSTYQHIEGEDYGKSRTNKETFFDKRAQYCWMLRERFYNTYLSVVRNKYIPPDAMISISSDIGKARLNQLRSETCRIPRKVNMNRRIQIMGKDEMLSKFKIKSPNLFDALFMSLKMPSIKEADVEMMPVPMLRRLGAPR